MSKKYTKQEAIKLLAANTLLSPEDLAACKEALANNTTDTSKDTPVESVAVPVKKKIPDPEPEEDYYSSSEEYYSSSNC